MKLFRHGLAALAAVLVVLPLTAGAQVIKKIDQDKEPTTDKEFLAKAIACDVCEIKLADLAIKNASSDEVKEFARKMREDHTRNKDALLEEAKEHKLAVVEGLEPEHKEKYDRLSKLEGKEFDREYMKIMVESHEKMLKMAETWSKKAEDKDLAALMTKAVPTIKQHLEHAKTLAGKVKE